MRPRKWGDPATVVALLSFAFGCGLVVVDGVDKALFGVTFDFGSWPYVLVGFAAFWFFGIRLGGGPGEKGG